MDLLGLGSRESIVFLSCDSSKFLGFLVLFLFTHHIVALCTYFNEDWGQDGVEASI